VERSVTDKPVGRTPRKRVAVIAALAAAVSLVGAQAANAQSGGVGAPGTTTTDPTTTTAPTGYSQVFPIPGDHTFGQGFGAARSGGRSHQGQDIMAPCGASLASVSRAKVKFVSYQALAGNYVVLRFKKLHQDYMYAHLATRAPLVKGQIVQAGQFVGTVGDTGDATTCHLHFELWVGKWYRGGHPVDPLTYLQAWDAYS
jgi:murein DD-endopeptidase MepM/ murein hydrolase activator NlpD